MEIWFRNLNLLQAAPEKGFISREMRIFATCLQKGSCTSNSSGRKDGIAVRKLLTKLPTYQPFLQSFSFLVGRVRNYHLFRLR